MSIRAFVILLVAAPLWAQVPGGLDHQRLETDPLCDVDLGRVQLGIDAYGATGSSISADECEAEFDPFDDAPDQGFVSTVFESMVHLCRVGPGGADGEWMESGRADAAAAVGVADGVIDSRFTMLGLEVQGRYQLNCTRLEVCYTFTNVTNDLVDSISVTP